MKHDPTPEQKAQAEARRAAFKELCKKIAAMTDDERNTYAQKMAFIATVEGHTLSSTNTLLVCFQYGNATIVGGFNQWKKNGRKVKKGEHGISIWIPRIPGTKEDEPPAEAEGFFMGYVFDVSQTEPIQQ